MAVKLGNGNWAVKEDKLLAYNDNSGLFFNKEFDFSSGTLNYLKCHLKKHYHLK